MFRRNRGQPNELSWPGTWSAPCTICLSCLSLFALVLLVGSLAVPRRCHAGERDGFRLTSGQLRELRADFSRQIKSGLARANQTVRAMQTHLGVPKEIDLAPGSGVAVIDTGGTRARAAVVTWDGEQFRLQQQPLSQELPLRQNPPISAQQFFQMQAELLVRAGAQAGMRLGYCFSYPSEAVQDPQDLVLDHWVKGVRVPDIVGRRVGELLVESMQIVPASRVTLNDTIAALINASIRAKDRRMVLAAIASTGTNSGGFFDQRYASKLDHGRVTALNLETGNLKPPQGIMTAADRRVDAEDEPGQQLFEKATSGLYLSRLMAVLHPEISSQLAHGGTALLAEIAHGKQYPRGQTAAQALFVRSAQLRAAEFLAILDSYPAGDVDILVEGQLYAHAPRYAETLRQTFDELNDTGRQARFLPQVDNINLLGAACAACMAD